MPHDTTSPTYLAGRRPPVRAVDVPGPAGAQPYPDPALDDVAEVSELIGRLASTTGGILELAAGSGRLTFALLTLGRPVTALDRSPHLLRLLRERLAPAPDRLRLRCSVIEADITSFALPDRFGAVVLATSAISLLDATGRHGLYRCVATHLAPGGLFLISTRTRRSVGYEGGGGRRYRLHDSWLNPPGRRFVARSGSARDVDPLVVTSVLRDLPPDLIEAELRLAGLTVLERQSLPTEPGQEHTILTACGRPAES